MTERVIDAVEDGIFLANQIYENALLRFERGISTSSGKPTIMLKTTPSI